MKKGVVLFITLFFITAISILVLKNLDDTDTFLEEQNYILNNTQVLIAIKNAKDEFVKLLNQNKNEVDNALSDNIFTNPVPISFNDLFITIKPSKYDKTDINDINDSKLKSVENLFYKENIFGYQEFAQIFKEKVTTVNKLTTTKQLDDIITTFKIDTDNQNIKKIKEKIGFVKDGKYELNITLKYYASKAKAYYILDQDGKVKYFDISFQ